MLVLITPQMLTKALALARRSVKKNNNISERELEKKIKNKITS